MCDNCEAFNRGSLVDFDIPKSTQDILIIGEAPGKEEIKQLRCFVGASGKFLRTILDEIGVLKRCFFANSVKCLHREFSKPSFNMILNCSDFLVKYVLENKPKYILCLGDTSATSAVIVIGRVEFLHDTYRPEIFFAEHPAYILRKNDEEEKENFKKIIKNIFTINESDEEYGIGDILGMSDYL